jgi:hypothetical protein
MRFLPNFGRKGRGCKKFGREEFPKIFKKGTILYPPHLDLT